MNADQVFEKIRPMIAEIAGRSVDDVQRDSTFDDLGLDSLDAVDLHVRLQDEFITPIDDADFEGIDSVQGVIDMLVSRLSGSF
jgi:acyl carrier protein